MEPSKFPCNLNLLPVFAALAETLSTTEAAKRLNLSQPAVSHALARLRVEMNDPLFVRKGGALVPTPRTLALVDAVNELLRNAERIYRSEKFEPATSTRNFRVALSDYASLALSFDLVRTFTSEAPSARLMSELVSPRSPAMLLDGDLDAIVWRRSDIEAPLKSAAVMTDRFVVAVRVDHPIIWCPRRQSITLEELVAYKHVQTQFASPRDAILDGAIEKLGMRREVVFATKDYRSALDMLPGSDLMLALPSRAFQKLSPPGVMSLALPFETEEITYDLVWDSRHEADDGLQWLLRNIRSLGRQFGSEVAVFA